MKHLLRFAWRVILETTCGALLMAGVLAYLVGLLLWLVLMGLRDKWAETGDKQDPRYCLWCQP